jgi:sporulation protein YlmC with PRC-barrel domain
VKLTDLVGHPVLDLATATTIGRIDDVVVDASTGRLRGFLLKKSPVKADWLPWERVNALGADALTVASVDAIAERPAALGRPLRADHVIGGRVLTEQGWERPHLADVDLDPASGQVTSLLLADGASLGPADLIGIGRYATVVKHQG